MTYSGTSSTRRTSTKEGSGKEKILAVKKLMLESLLNYRHHCLTENCLLIALENIIIDKVTTHLSSKVKKIDTCAPIEIGMADGEEAFVEGCGKASELAVQAVYKETGAKCGWSGGKGPSWSVQKYFISGERVKKGANRGGKGQWSKTGGKKRRKRTRERWERRHQSLLELRGNRTHCGKLREGELEQDSERCGRRQRRHQWRSA